MVEAGAGDDLTPIRQGMASVSAQLAVWHSTLNIVE
jgi:hypothetical protein